MLNLYLFKFTGWPVLLVISMALLLEVPSIYLVIIKSLAKTSLAKVVTEIKLLSEDSK